VDESEVEHMAPTNKLQEHNLSVAGIHRQTVTWLFSLPLTETCAWAPHDFCYRLTGLTGFLTKYINLGKIDPTTETSSHHSVVASLSWKRHKLLVILFLLSAPALHNSRDFWEVAEREIKRRRRKMAGVSRIAVAVVALALASAFVLPVAQAQAPAPAPTSDGKKTELSLYILVYMCLYFYMKVNLGSMRNLYSFTHTWACL